MKSSDKARNSRALISWSSRQIGVVPASTRRYDTDRIDREQQPALLKMNPLLIVDQRDIPPRMAILTPPSRGAIGVVRVWGRAAVETVDAAFRPARGSGLAGSPAGRPRLGRMGRGLGDEVVAVVLPGVHPPSVEIQCHGGAVAIGLVVEALREAGARVVEPTDWAEAETRSPIQAQALIDLARAPTLRAAEILLEQARGALDRELARLVEMIRQGDANSAEQLDRLIDRGRVGLRLLKGWRVVIAGRPNVGKSRLLNALAGYQRAIVHSAPGTTRDVVTVATALDGWPVELVDTAGLRVTDDPIERSGIDRARRQAEAADLVLKVLDHSEPLRDEDLEPIARPSAALLVASKSDLPPAWSLSDPVLEKGRTEFIPFHAGAEVLSISAETGQGLDLLIDAIVKALLPHPPEVGSGVPFRQVHLDVLCRAREILRSGGLRLAAREIEGLGS
ncbi:MAG: GTPase [Isosphaeraceae bacterium]